MKKELFDRIFDNEILPFINEINGNNSMIEMKDLVKCKADIHNEYMKLNSMYKEQIFDKDLDKELLDRHKVASCVCGAFLKVPVFNKTKLIQYIKAEHKKVEVYFYYVNELVALFAATKFLSFFMIADNKEHIDLVHEIHRNFPMMPPITKNKRGFWNSVLFNLSQIKDEKQIGLENYDMYSYAMFFFLLETYFNESVAA
ncbi:MAG: hypothetical protein K2K46_14050 [Lachnospiraceae bacterium]|nr:hypothetical protein [Lachnospiraceae bacterium]